MCATGREEASISASGEAAGEEAGSPPPKEAAQLFAEAEELLEGARSAVRCPTTHPPPRSLLQTSHPRMDALFDAPTTQMQKYLPTQWRALLQSI